MKNRVGVDIGGTNIKIALITNEGKILYSKTFPTEAEKGYEYTVANIKEEIKVLMTETESTSKTIETSTVPKEETTKTEPEPTPETEPTPTPAPEPTSTEKETNVITNNTAEGI